MATIRTVSTHGAPTEADGLVVNLDGPFVTSATDLDFGPDDRWVPLAEIADLPPAPLPPVTITIPRDVAQTFADCKDPLARTAGELRALVRDALEGDR